MASTPTPTPTPTPTATMPSTQEMETAAATFAAADTAMLAQTQTALETIQEDFNNALDSIKNIRATYPGASATYTQKVLDGYINQFTSYKQAVDSIVTSVNAMAQQTVQMG